MVKNCSVFRQAYTRPCISGGISVRKIMSIFAFINGMFSQPKTAPIHQMTGVLPNARRKFSVLIEINNEVQIALTLFFGAGISVVMILPANAAIPTQVLIAPKTVSPPLFFESIIAGSAAS